MANFNQSLIEVIKGNGKLVPQLVKHWVKQYEKDPKPALFELLKMLFEACGAKCDVQEEFLEESNVEIVVNNAVNMSMGGGEDYQSSKKEFKNFKDNLVSFWNNLVIECQNGPLFDQILFDKCIDYIIALSCTSPRVFRQVASLMGLQLVTSLIAVVKALDEEEKRSKKQLNAEWKKRVKGPHAESMNKLLSRTHTKIEVIRIMMTKIFNELFVSRHCDVDPDIRMSCIESLGVWIMSYPSLSLWENSLKYFSWSLNDNNAGVRKASILGLQNLYRADHYVTSLAMFDRIIELTDDINVSVAQCATKLVKQLLRHPHLAKVNEEMIGILGHLLVNNSTEFKGAIGALVYDHLISEKSNSSQSHVKGDDGDSSDVLLDGMLKFLKEFSTDPILSISIIDAVWEYMDAMKDWKCIISKLLDDHPLTELTDEDTTNLIRILCASVKKAVGESIVRTPDKQKQISQEKISKNRHDITVAMMENYSQLLGKFMADKTKVPSLIEIIVHMDLELYPLNGQEQNFKALLQLMKEAFFKHGEKDALRSCVKAINFCSSECQGELKDFAKNKLKELEDDLIAKLKTAIDKVKGGDNEYSLLVNLKGLYELQLSSFASIESLYEDIVTILKSFKNMDEEVISFLLHNMYLHVAWCLHSIINSDTVSKKSLLSLLSKRTSLVKQLEQFLDTLTEVQVGRHGNQPACRVFIILAEVLCLFKETKFSSTKLEILGYRPDSSILLKLWKLFEHINLSEGAYGNREFVETNGLAVVIAAENLVTCDTVPKWLQEKLGPEILSYFIVHLTKVTEIKDLIVVLKDVVNVPDIFLEALKKAYQQHLVELSRGENNSLAGKSLKKCRDMAARLSATFVGGAARNKHDILKIVKDGIAYAYVDAPKRLPFLEVVVLHFASRLPARDRLKIQNDVQKRESKHRRRS